MTRKKSSGSGPTRKPTSTFAATFRRRLENDARDTATRGHGDAETRRRGDAETRRNGEIVPLASPRPRVPASPRLRVPASPRLLRIVVIFHLDESFSGRT